MRKNAILPALKQKFSDGFLAVFIGAFVLAIVMEFVNPSSFDFWPLFLVLFILILAVYLIFSVKPWKFLKKEKIETVGQAESFVSAVPLLKKEKKTLLKDRMFWREKLTEANKLLDELQGKKEQFGDMVLNVTDVEEKIQLVKWDKDRYLKNLESIDGRIEEIDDRINQGRKDIEMAVSHRQEK